MWGTYQFLAAMLDREIGQESPMPFFAMLNSAKCSGADGRMDKVPDALHWRCRGYALGELAVLDPSIVWLQGSTVRNVFDSNLSQPSNLDQRISSWLDSEGINGSRVAAWMFGVAHEYFRTFSNAGKSILAIITPHPSDRYGRWGLFERTMMKMVAEIAVGLARKK
ncbi:MAG TPA: hypothetical protein VIJ35_16970 [Bradyrhizobium sp.]